MMAMGNYHLPIYIEKGEDSDRGEMTEDVEELVREPELLKLMRAIDVITHGGELPTVDRISETVGIEPERVLYELTRLAHGGAITAEEWENGDRKVVYRLTEAGHRIIKGSDA